MEEQNTNRLAGEVETGQAKIRQQTVLLISYSFSGQARMLAGRLAAGLTRKGGVKVIEERIEPKRLLRFPIGTIIRTLRMMLTTFLRFRESIHPPAEHCFNDYDLVILAGPTWSYNPSGPILSLIDHYGTRLFSGKSVLPLISCRGYWRMHLYGLRRLLERCGAEVPNAIVFSHPCPEPWSTVGVFLKLAGKMPEKSPFFSRYYRRYGHSREQHEEAFLFGVMIAKALLEGEGLATLNFQTDIALP